MSEGHDEWVMRPGQILPAKGVKRVEVLQPELDGLLLKMGDKVIGTIEGDCIDLWRLILNPPIVVDPGFGDDDG